MPNVHITGRRYTAPREALKPHRSLHIDGNLADRSPETGSPLRASLKGEQREQ